MNTQKFYDQMVARGVAPRLAEMLALRQPPGTVGTDRAFLEGTCNGRQFEDMPDVMAKQYLADAKEAGINTTGKVYKSGLADWRGGGDPMAWVSSVDDVKKVCQLRNLNCDGAVKHRAVQMQPERPIRLAEDIVQRKIRDETAKNPALKLKKKAELREMVIDKYAPPVV